LNIVGKNLDPDKITQAIGVEPDSCGKRGEPMTYGDGKKKQGYWTICRQRSNATYETQFKNIIKRIEPHQKRLRHIIAGKDVYQAYLEIAVRPLAKYPVSKYEFKAELLDMFMSMGVDIGLSVWIPLMDEDDVYDIKNRAGKKRKKPVPFRWVGLKIMGKNLDPDRITQAIGVEPDECGKRGEPMTRSEGKCKQGFWTICRQRSNATYENQFKNIIKRIEPHQRRLRQIIAWKDVQRACLEIVVSPPAKYPLSGYEFKAELLDMFTSIGFDVVFSVRIPITKEED
jgi:hypothetical protein